jgi:hypothetical protein
MDFSFGNFLTWLNTERKSLHDQMNDENIPIDTANVCACAAAKSCVAIF